MGCEVKSFEEYQKTDHNACSLSYKAGYYDAKEEMSYDVHTCHNDCKRHACVMRRKIESLTKKNEILLKGLELIKQYHCACSIDDEIIPQVTARQAIKDVEGLG